MGLKSENWPNFIQSLYPLLSSSNPELIISGLVVLQNFFDICGDFFAKEYD